MHKDTNYFLGVRQNGISYPTKIQQPDKFLQHNVNF